MSTTHSYVLFSVVLALTSMSQAHAGLPLHKELQRKRPGVLLDTGRARNLIAAHGAITHDLYNGSIVSVEPFSKDGNNHKVYRARIRGFDPYTGQERWRDAIFKPKTWGDDDGWSRAPMEFVAYFLNRK